MDALLKSAKKPADEDDDEDAEGDDEDAKKAKKARRDEKAAKAEEKAEKDDAEMAAKAKKDKEEAAKAAAAGVQKKDYSDKERGEMAGKGEAMEDGSFPIKTKKDLENAVQSYGRAKDKAEAKAHITARAKALGAEDMLPDDWKGSKKSAGADLKKSMHDVARTACIIEELNWLAQSVTYEEAIEGDDSTAPKEIKDIIGKLCEYLTSRVKEETEELLETHGDDDDDILAMAAGVPANGAKALSKFAKGKLAEALVKAGARHSKADMEKFADMHKMVKDHADAMSKMADDHCEAMGKCMKDAGMIPDSDDGEDDMEPHGKNAKKMSKLYEQLNAKTDEVLAVSKVAAASNETLLKAIPLIESLQKQIGTLQEEKSELAKRMEHLEKQPAAPKGHVRVISKTQDGGASGETEAEYKVRMAKMAPAERNRELMKLAMSNPMEMTER
jgi:hypothetical protein